MKCANCNEEADYIVNGFSMCKCKCPDFVKRRWSG